MAIATNRTSLKQQSPIQHIVLRIDEAVVHLYSVSSFPTALITEAKKHLTGVYFYDKHQPHAPSGQYHLHIYLKNNQIFAINWDGSAHDQSHGTVIPGKVFNALKQKFPDLQLPANRFIESLDLQNAQTEVAQASEKELVLLKKTLLEEVQIAGRDAFPPSSKFLIFEGNYIPLIGWSLLLIGAEYRDNGDVAAEGHLIWLVQKKNKLESWRVTVKRASVNAMSGPLLNFLCNELLEQAKARAYAFAYATWGKNRRDWISWRPDFRERSFHDLLRFWLFGKESQLMKFVSAKTEINIIRVHLAMITRLTPLKWLSEDL